MCPCEFPATQFLGLPQLHTPICKPWRLPSPFSSFSPCLIGLQRLGPYWILNAFAFLCPLWPSWGHLAHSSLSGPFPASACSSSHPPTPRHKPLHEAASVPFLCSVTVPLTVHPGPVTLVIVLSLPLTKLTPTSRTLRSLCPVPVAFPAHGSQVTAQMSRSRRCLP